MIKVVAKNFIKEDSVDKVLELIHSLVEETVKEKGCIKYEAYEDKKDPTVFFMLEEWESMEDLNNHGQSEHFTRIVPQIREYSRKESELNICKKL